MKHLSHSAVTQPVIYGYQFSFPKFRSQRTLQEGGSRRVQVSRPCKSVVMPFVFLPFPGFCSNLPVAYVAPLLPSLPVCWTVSSPACCQGLRLSSLSLAGPPQNEQKRKNPPPNPWAFLMSFGGRYIITLNISNIHTQRLIRVDVALVCLEKILDILGIDSPPSAPTILSSFISHSAPLHRLCASRRSVSEYSVLLVRPPAHGMCPLLLHPTLAHWWGGTPILSPSGCYLRDHSAFSSSSESRTLCISPWCL